MEIGPFQSEAVEREWATLSIRRRALVRWLMLVRLRGGGADLSSGLRRLGISQSLTGQVESACQDELASEAGSMDEAEPSEAYLVLVIGGLLFAILWCAVEWSVPVRGTHGSWPLVSAAVLLHMGHVLWKCLRARTLAVRQRKRSRTR